jgi:hypothetical protein
MNGFKKPGLLDPSDAAIHGESTSEDNDFALISLAPNPFATSPDYICIMVAGIHGPGTAHAVKALAEDDFRDHPFGGIIEVSLDPFTDWPTRFQQASWSWQTKPYDSEKLLANLKGALMESSETRDRVFEHLSDAEIEKCIRFIEHIAKEAASSTD